MSESEEIVRSIMERRERIKEAKVAGMPEVGIFWVLKGGKLLQSSVPFNEGIDFGDFTLGPADHYQFWEQVRRHVPAIKGLEYDEVPRGRVSYRKSDRAFIILGSRKMLHDAKATNLVKREFRLGGRKVILDPDEHYEL